MEENFIVECNVCGQHFENWVGSTPCCGSIAYRLDKEGKKTSNFLLYGEVKINNEEQKGIIEL